MTAFLYLSLPVRPFLVLPFSGAELTIQLISAFMSNACDFARDSGLGCVAVTMV